MDNAKYFPDFLPRLFAQRIAIVICGRARVSRWEAREGSQDGASTQEKDMQPIIDKAQPGEAMQQTGAVVPLAM